jgi:hypothetical protein
VFALLLALTACRARPEFENPPPCVPLVGPGEVRGQAIWINRRALTAAHVLTYGGAEFPPARVVLNGDPTPIVLYQSGNPGVLPPGGTPRMWTEDCAEDWAAFEVMLSAPRWSPLLAGGGKLQPGETLWVLAFDPDALDGTRPKLLASRLIVRPAPAIRGADGRKRPLDPRVIVAWGQCPKGFSGGFVGRYHADKGRWEYVGHLAATGSVNGRELNFVVRPPAEVVAWLLEGQAEPDAVRGTPPRIAAGSR